MKEIIKNKKDLKKYLKNNYDYNPSVTYLAMNEDGECFAIFGCTHATEAIRSLDDTSSLVITSDDYETEIQEQTAAKDPELSGFPLK